MPLNVRRFGAVVLIVFAGIVEILAQTPSTTSADVMRDRVTKAKAFIAVKNFNAAIYELEGIRRETSDTTVRGVVNVILMNCYLEQGDYKRAQAFLTELYNQQKANKPNAAENYFAVAAQVVKGARNQFERYKSLGLSTKDRNLPPDAVADIDKMRETVEKVIEQSKLMSAEKAKSSDALALIEESSNARIALSRDDYDAKRWKEEVADARDGLMNSRSKVINAVEEPAGETIASTTPAYTGNIPAGANLKTETLPKIETPPMIVQTSAQTPVVTEPKQTPTGIESKPEPESEPTQTVGSVKETPQILTPNIAEQKAETPKILTPNVAEQSTETAPNAGGRERLVTDAKTDTPATVAENTDVKADGSPMKIGSLVEFATQKVAPVYPPQAKTLRLSGVVKVEFTVDENGKVADVRTSTGPSMLQRAAVDAIRRWKFKPFTKDGQPVKANGFVNFNFNL